MTFTAVLVVFLALLMLVLIFRCIGIFFQRRNAPKVEKPATQKAPAASSTGNPSAEALVAISLALQSAAGKPDEVAAVIAMALRSELETQHDHESYVLTIRHRPTDVECACPTDSGPRYQSTYERKNKLCYCS